MGTAALLDVSRSECIELPVGFSRNLRGLSLPTKNLVRRWRHTGSWTLDTLNDKDEFAATLKWDALKFGPNDVLYDPDWWDYKETRLTAEGDKCDFFFIGKVSAENAGLQQVPGNVNIFQLPSITRQIVEAMEKTRFDRNLGNDTEAFISKADYPANQGYCVRFGIETVPGSFDAGLMTFFFGEYALRLNGDGVAELSKAADESLSEWDFVYSFLWAKPSEIVGRSHILIIAPHARNCIEFLAGTGGQHLLHTPWGDVYRNQRGVHGGGLYEVPGKLRFDENGVPLITARNPWRLFVNQRFRPKVQVSRLGYYNGIDRPAILWDNAIGLYSGATVPFQIQPIGDPNGCDYAYSLCDPETGVPVGMGGLTTQVQFRFQFFGKGDVAGPGKASTTSPELYGYTVYKPGVYRVNARDTVTGESLSQSIDYGKTPEDEKLSLILNNAYGQLDAFRHRVHVPMELYDTASGVTYFEGTAITMKAGEAPANKARTLHAETVGMADYLMRREWAWLRPDFGVDPYDQQGRGWRPGDVIRHCFGVAGFDPESQVVIEEEEVWWQVNGEYFRLWMWGDAGGAASGRGQIGKGGSGSGFGGLWMPLCPQTIYEFLDWFIRDVFGWQPHWNRETHAWHIYKRPHPQNLHDIAVGKFVPKVAFYRNSALVKQAPDGLPSYAHHGFETVTQRPLCTTMIASCHIADTQVGTPPNTPPAVSDPQGLSPADNRAIDPRMGENRRRVTRVFDNPKGYGANANPLDNLGTQQFRSAPLNFCASYEALNWCGRRLFEDNCFGQLCGQFTSWWGDQHTAYLRKYDIVLVDSGDNGEVEPWYIDHIEPEWSRVNMRRAHYFVTRKREDAPAPR